MHASISFLITALAGMLAGCLQDKKQVAPAGASARVKELEILFRVTDEKGVPKQVFEEGENLFFSLLIKNSSEGAINIGQWDFPVAQPDFFTVYRVSEKENGSGLVGKSFRLSLNTRDLHPQQVPPKGHLEYRAPWLLTPDADFPMPVYHPAPVTPNIRTYRALEPPAGPLPAGQYVSKVSVPFGEQPVNLEVSFSVR